MRQLLLIALGTTALTAAACAEDTETKATDAPAATEMSETAGSAAEAPMAGDSMADDEAMAEPVDLSGITSGTYEMDTTHGYVTFSYSHVGFSHPILRFDDVTATVELDVEDPSLSTLNVDIDPASIDSGVAKFDDHLTSGDMFDVATYPEITFVSTDIDLDAMTLTGDLTMKDVTRPVTLDVVLNGASDHPMSGKDTFGISATATIDRTEWGIDYAAPAVSAEVDLRIEAEFVKAE